jgi:hypothetical protein
MTPQFVTLLAKGLQVGQIADLPGGSVLIQKAEAYIVRSARSKLLEDCSTVSPC